MGGWNICYGLLNFAILAAILYFFGRKLVVNMFKTRRDRIAGDLERARQAEENAASADPEIDALVAARTAAKKAKNYAEADRIRDELKARGIESIDTPQGPKWKKL